MSKTWAELTTNLESASTERLLALYLLRFKEALEKGDAEREGDVARDCEPILAEARRRDAELAERDAGTVMRPVSAVVDDAAARKQLVSAAVRALLVLRRRYQIVHELAGVFREIDALAENVR